MSESNEAASSPRSKKDFSLARRLLGYLRRHPWVFYTGIAAMLCSYTLSVLSPAVIRFGIDNNVLKGDLEGLKKTTLILCAVLVGELLFHLLYRYAVEYLGQRLAYAIRMDLVRKILSLTRSYFDKTPIGNVLTKVTSDVEAIEEFIAEGVVAIVGNSLKVLFILAAMFAMDAKLASITLITVPAFLAVTFLFRKALRTGYRGARKANADISTILVESLNGIRELHLFQRRAKSVREFDAANQQYKKSYEQIIHAYSLYFPAVEVISRLSTVGVLFLAHSLLQSEVQIGEIFAFFVYLNMFFQPLHHLAEQFNVFQSAMAASERIFSLLETKPDFVEDKTAERIRLPSPSIEFRNVRFQYKAGEPVLKNLSFKIAAGEVVALVGSTGAGKTTITQLLNRLYDIEEGEILVGGKNIKSMTFNNLREHIATVTQNVFMFTGTVGENIHLHKYNEDEVLTAARRASADGFVQQLPNNYGHMVLEEGKSLSTGQKQLIALSRAFIKKSPILILDEATANIDSHSEELIERALRELFHGRTALIIAHRLSTIRNADRILVLHKGELVEEGSHAQLIQKPNGLYRKLYEMQALSLQGESD